MTQDQIIHITREALLLLLLLSAPFLLASLVVSFIVGLFQAATQIQDPTLTFVPKLFVLLAVLAIFAPFITAQLIRFTEAIMGIIPGV